MCAQNILDIPPGYDGTALAVLRYVKKGRSPSRHLPTTKDWPDPYADGNSCPDLTSDDLVPVIKAEAPKTVLSTWFLVRYGLCCYLTWI
jgi:hypothetical protein